MRFAGEDMNLYGYVMHDPVNWSDPLGLERIFEGYATYEAKHYPIVDPDPIVAIVHRIEVLNLTYKNLEPMLGVGRLWCGYTCLGQQPTDRHLAQPGPPGAAPPRLLERRRQRDVQGCLTPARRTE